MRKTSLLIVGISLLAMARLVKEPRKTKSRPRSAMKNAEMSKSSQGKLDKLESEFTPRGVVVTLAVTIFYAILVGLLFAHDSDTKPKDTFEYFSYILPICAAIVAGATVFIEERKGLLFIATVFLLYLGIVAFIAMKDEKGTILILSSIVMSLIISYHVIVLGYRSIKRIYVKNGLPAAWREGVIQALCVGAIVVAGVLFGRFFIHHRTCITASDAKAAAQCGAAIAPLQGEKSAPIAR